MALTYEELESVTNDYFAADGKKAVDIYFDSSWLLNFLLKNRKGLWKMPSGGRRIRVPLEYDGQEANFYSRGETISSDDRESVNAAYFLWKHCYGNATILRVDELENADAYAEVELVTTKVAGAQKSLTKVLAGSIYDDVGGASSRLTGIRACCHETAGTPYGGIEEEDLVAADGTKPWEGKRKTSSEAISLPVIRTMATDAKVRDGKGGKPDIVPTTEALFNQVVDILQIQQRFVNSAETAKAGFTGVEFEGKIITPDDYVPSGWAFALNSKHMGFAVHKNGNYVRTKWAPIPDRAGDRTMKIFWDGNLIVNNRKAHKAHSGLS